MRFDKKAFTLIELLVVTALIAIAAPLVARSLVQSVKAAAAIRSDLNEGRLGGRLFSRLEADLRNSVTFSPVPFNGGNYGLSFAAMEDGIVRVNYALKDGAVIRKESPAGTDAAADEAVLAAGVNGFKLEYAHRESGGRVVFLPYWLEPNRLPKAVRITVLFKEMGAKSRLVLLPQGVMGQVS